MMPNSLSLTTTKEQMFSRFQLQAIESTHIPGAKINSMQEITSRESSMKNKPQKVLHSRCRSNIPKFFPTSPNGRDSFTIEKMINIGGKLENVRLRCPDPMIITNRINRAKLVNVIKSMNTKKIQGSSSVKGSTWKQALNGGW